MDTKNYFPVFGGSKWISKSFMELCPPFLPLDENAKADLYENAWAIIEDFRKKI